ncbi:MAG: hypothetical protein ACM3H7_03710 [Acidobacteriaceae bacterium]
MVITNLEALALDFPGSYYPLLNHRRGLAQTIIAELFVFHARHLDVDVDAIQQRP